jgi:hypothetical protein
MRLLCFLDTGVAWKVTYSSSAAGANAPRQLVAGAIITTTIILSQTRVDSVNKYQ